MEKKEIKIPLITIDDVYHNEMVGLVLYIAAEVLRKEKGHEESYVIRVYETISRILSCFERINQACNFINKRTTIKELDKNEEMTVIDYYTYHYDVIVHKLSTIRDLSLKLINEVFNLGLDDRICNWYNIKKKKNRITVPGVLYIQDLHYYLLRDIEEERNAFTHNASFDIKMFNNIESIAIKLSQLVRLEKIPNEVVDFAPMSKRTYDNYFLNKKKKELLELINKNKSISLFCIHILTCSMSNIFKSKLSKEIQEKYAKTILLANQRINTYGRKNNKIELLIPYLAKIEDWNKSLKDYYEGKKRNGISEIAG